jgi:Domain of unknown function (DUF3883)
LEHRIKDIEDRRDRPGYGHDFLSFSTNSDHRYIEVKCVAKVNDGYRFFLSDNEHQTSLSKEHEDGYYFYLVYFGSNGEPVELEAVAAKHLYPRVEMLPSSYEVRFDRREFKEADE